MSSKFYMDEARQIAAQCWCDEETKDRVMDPQLAEAVARRIATWMHNSATFSDNADFYRGILHQCVDNLGPLKDKAFIQDDGGVVDQPLVLKIPGIVAELTSLVDIT